MVRVVASTRIPDLGDGYRTTPCISFMNQYNSKRVLAMYAQPGYGGAMDADEYGFQSNYQGVHFIFNLRHARDGKRKNIVFQAPAEKTLDSVLQNPIVPGLDYLDDWFEESNLAAPEFANWPEINPYTAWDIEYRFGHAFHAELEDAQKEHDAKKCRELIEQMKARIREQLLLAVEERKQAPLFQDVRDLDLVPPFSAWLCKHPREILSDLCSSKRDSSGHLPWEISVVIWQLWKRNPDWMKLPRDVFRLLRQHISRVSWKFVIDDFYRGKRE